MGDDGYIDLDAPESAGLRDVLYDPAEYDGFQPESWEGRPAEADHQYLPIDNLPDAPPSHGDHEYVYDESREGGDSYGVEAGDYHSFAPGVRDIDVFWRWVNSMDAAAVGKHAVYWRRVSELLGSGSEMLRTRRDTLVEAWGGDAAEVFLERVGAARYSIDDWGRGAGNNAGMLEFIASDVEFAKDVLGTLHDHYQAMVRQWESWPEPEMVVYHPEHASWTADFGRIVAPPEVQELGLNHGRDDMYAVTSRDEIKGLYHNHAANVIQLLADGYVSHHYSIDQPREFQGSTALAPVPGADGGGPGGGGAGMPGTPLSGSSIDSGTGTLPGLPRLTPPGAGLLPAPAGGGPQPVPAVPGAGGGQLAGLPVLAPPPTAPGPGLGIAPAPGAAPLPPPGPPGPLGAPPPVPRPAAPGIPRPAVAPGAPRPAVAPGAPRPAVGPGAPRPAVAPGAPRPAVVPGGGRPAPAQGTPPAVRAGGPATGATPTGAQPPSAARVGRGGPALPGATVAGAGGRTVPPPGLTTRPGQATAGAPSARPTLLGQAPAGTPPARPTQAPAGSPPARPNLPGAANRAAGPVPARGLAGVAGGATGAPPAAGDRTGRDRKAKRGKRGPAADRRDRAPEAKRPEGLIERPPPHRPAPHGQPIAPAEAGADPEPRTTT